MNDISQQNHSKNPDQSITEPAIASPTEQPNPTLEKLKLLGVIIVILTFTLYATQDWKGDAGIPTNFLYDLPFHSYRMWFTADHLQHLNFDFDWDYKSNALFARAYPLLPYLVGAPFVMLAGLWQGISYYVLLWYFLLGLGMYFLGKTLKLSSATSLFMSLAMLLSYALVLETQWAGALHRLFAYMLLPFILICFLKREQTTAKIALPVLLAAAVLSHFSVGIYCIIILGILAAMEIAKKASISALKEHLPLAIGILMSIVIASPLIGTVLIEQSTGALNVPPYQKESRSVIDGRSAPVPQALFDRKFGIVENRNVNGYLGLSIILLALLGLALSENRIKIALAILIAIFYIILSNSELMPPILQGVHYSRPLFMISFFLTILAALAIEKITQITSKITNLKLVKTSLSIVMFIIVFIDLSPGVNPFPNSAMAEYNDVFKNLEITERIITSKLSESYAWSPFSTSDFIQFSDELTNPEYNSFARNINGSNPDYEQRFSLLGLETYVDLRFKEEKVYKKTFTASRVFQPAIAALIEVENITAAENIFDKIISQPNYSRLEIGFILPRNVDPQEKINYIASQQESGIILRQISDVAQSPQTGKDLGWSKDSQGNLQVQVNSPGWVFVSQMWYPHWRVNGKPVQEAGGGLIAFYADKPGEYKIYWERPWYDYVFWTISLATLGLLIYLAFNPKKHEELLAKITGN